MSAWEDRGFSKARTAKGTLRIDMMGQSMEMPYEADLYLDEAGAVGAVVADSPQGRTWMFVSLTDTGATYTQPAPRPGDIDIEGDRLVAVASTDRDALLDAHVAAVGDAAKADRDALDAALEQAPQNAVRLAAEIMKRMAAGFAQKLQN